MRRSRIPLPRRPRIPIFAYLAVMGPGIITAAANNDAGGITTYSVAGARFGYDLLWILLLLTILLAVTQEMGARMGAVTGKGLADLIREEFGLRTSIFALIVLLAANAAVAASEFAGIASGFELFGLSKYLSVPIAAAAIWFLVTSGSFRQVERIFMVFVLFYGTYVLSGLLSDPPWEDVFARMVVPAINTDSRFILMVIAATGTTVAPWGQFFIQSYVRDKGVQAKDFAFTRFDVLSGAVFTSVIAFFIIVATATTIFHHGLGEIETAEDAARALAPLAGRQAKALFGIGLVGASTLAAAIIPLSTAYVTCEAFGWESGVGKSWAAAPMFNGLFTGMLAFGAAVVLIPKIHLISVMVLAQTLNGVLLPAILFYSVRLAGSRDLMGDKANGRVHTSLISAASIVVAGLSLYLVFNSLTGRSS